MTQTLFERETSKRQKNLRLSREICGVLSRKCEHYGQSRFVEEAVWKALVDEHGLAEIRDTIEEVQEQDIEPHHRVDEDHQEQHTVEA